MAAGSWTEFWDNNGDTLYPVPLWHVNLEITANGGLVPNSAVSSYSTMPNSDIYAESPGGYVDFVIGGSTPRCHSAGYLWQNINQPPVTPVATTPTHTTPPASTTKTTAPTSTPAPTSQPIVSPQATTTTPVTVAPIQTLKVQPTKPLNSKKTAFYVAGISFSSFLLLIIIGSFVARMLTKKRLAANDRLDYDLQNQPSIVQTTNYSNYPPLPGQLNNANPQFPTMVIRPARPVAPVPSLHQPRY